jgi:hypothetical protein
MVQSTGGYPTFEMETKEELDTVFKAAYTDQNDSIDEDIMESEEDNDFLNPELNYEKS